jgi:hypothetical protein
MKRFVRWAARLYPAEWRTRYGGEFDVLLDDAALQWSDLADVIRGAAIMHATSWMSYWKMALLSGIAGAILAGAVAFAIHDRYICAAALMLQGQSRDAAAPSVTRSQVLQRLQELLSRVLSHDNLVALIDGLDLYPRERTRLSVADIAEDTMRKRVHVSPYATADGPGTQAFRIWFEYPDKVKAREVVEQLVSDLVEGNLRSQSIPSTIAVLERPITPERPISPYRPAIVILGLIAGMLTGLISLKIWRRTRAYAVLTMSIPKETKRFVDNQVAAGQFRSVSEYLRELIRADELRHK